MTVIYKDADNLTRKNQSTRRRKYQTIILFYNCLKMYLISCCQMTNTIYVVQQKDTKSLFEEDTE